MCSRAIEKVGPRTGAAGDRTMRHPLDDWLRRELQALCGDPSADPLPRDIAALAARLEQRLAAADGRDEATGDGNGPRHGKTQR